MLAQRFIAEIRGRVHCTSCYSRQDVQPVLDSFALAVQVEHQSIVFITADRRNERGCGFASVEPAYTTERNA